jgi:hypothetical protein
MGPDMFPSFVTKDCKLVLVVPLLHIYNLIVFVNGFALSNHAVIGPQQKLYLPGLFSQADGRK